MRICTFYVKSVTIQIHTHPAHECPSSYRRHSHISLFFFISSYVKIIYSVFFHFMCNYMRLSSARQMHTNPSIPVIPPAVKAILSTAFVAITPHSFASANATTKPNTNDTAVPRSNIMYLCSPALRGFHLPFAGIHIFLCSFLFRRMSK